MKNEKIFDDWKKQRSQFDISSNFTEKVMGQVHQYQQERKPPLFSFQWLIETITAHPLVQAAMIVVGAMVGFIRVAIMLHIMLFT